MEGEQGSRNWSCKIEGHVHTGQGIPKEEAPELRFEGRREGGREKRGREEGGREITLDRTRVPVGASGVVRLPGHEGTSVPWNPQEWQGERTSLSPGSTPRLGSEL